MGIVLFVLLVEHEVDEKRGRQHGGLAVHVQVHGESDAEVVRIGQRLLDQARPLLANLPHLGAVQGVDPEHDVPAAAELAARRNDAQLLRARAVAHGEFGLHHRAYLLDPADGGAFRRLHFQLLLAAAAPAAAAAQRTREPKDLLLLVVGDAHVERSRSAAALAIAAAGFLRGQVDLLAHGILHRILVGCLPSGERLQQLDFLLDEQLVDLGEVLQARSRAWRKG